VLVLSEMRSDEIDRGATFVVAVPLSTARIYFISLLFVFFFDLLTWLTCF